MLELPELFGRLGVALGLGLLIGLQRQRTDSRLAGFRTFPLISALGALCGLLAPHFGGWVVAGGFASLALVIIGGRLPLRQAEEDPPGVTTEIAMLVMFAVAAYGMIGSTAVAIAVGGATAVLLHLKPQLHTLAAKIGDRDFTAVMQFVLISLVILPVLPQQNYGPFNVLNPFKIWLMVVLIVGISLGGYIIYKFVGTRAGVWASGILGGLISSTATTVSHARRSQQNPQTPALGAFVILLASAVVFLRVAILVGATAPTFARFVVIPFVVMFAVLCLMGWLNLRGVQNAASPMPTQENPSELKPAVLFGLLYAGVLMAVAAAKKFLGDSGLFGVAALSGLTDMDAITLSVSQLTASAEISEVTGLRLILVASLSNLIFKAGTVAMLGTRGLLVRIAWGFGIAAVVAIGLLAFWPARSASG